MRCSKTDKCPQLASSSSLEACTVAAGGKYAHILPASALLRARTHALGSYRATRCACSETRENGSARREKEPGCSSAGPRVHSGSAAATGWLQVAVRDASEEKGPNNVAHVGQTTDHGQRLIRHIGWPVKLLFYCVPKLQPSDAGKCIAVLVVLATAIESTKETRNLRGQSGADQRPAGHA